VLRPLILFPTVTAQIWVLMLNNVIHASVWILLGLVPLIP
jgi:hypothetical protein